MLAFLKAFDPIEWLLIAVIAALSVLFVVKWSELGTTRVELSHAQTKVAQSEKDLADYKASVAETTRLLQASNDRNHIAQLNQVQEAMNAANVRSTKLAADAASAQSALDRLRSAVRLAARRDSVPSATSAPEDQPTSTVAQLFLECATAYGQLAEKADRHASDVQTLTDAWPK